MLLGKHYLFLFPSKTHKKFPSQLDKSSEFLRPGRVKMLEKVSNSQPKSLSIINFQASSSEHLYFSKPARFLWGTDKVRNRFVGSPCRLPTTSTALPRGAGTPIWNRRGCSSEILNLSPKGDHLGVAQAFCDP